MTGKGDGEEEGSPWRLVLILVVRYLILLLIAVLAVLHFLPDE